MFTKLQAPRLIVCKTCEDINAASWSVFTVDLVTYITGFQWDMAKYPIKQSLKNISEIISKVSVAYKNVHIPLLIDILFSQHFCF